MTLDGVRDRIGGKVLAPDGAMECSHGWSSARCKAGGAQPVDLFAPQQSRPGRGGGKFRAQKQCRRASSSRLVVSHTCQLNGRILRPSGAKRGMMYRLSTGFASGRYAAAPLHPWLQPVAPPGREFAPDGERSFPTGTAADIVTDPG